MGLSSTSRERFYFYRGCTFHLTYRTAEAANKHDRWLACTICDGQADLPHGYKEASDWAKLAAPMLAKHAVRGEVITEPRTLGKEWGPFDFGVLVCAEGGALRMVYFEVDGEQHEEQYHETTAGEQWDRDRQKDEKAWRAGVMLVRLHYSDSKFWEDTISRAIGLAKQQRPYKLLWYTKGHGLRGKHSPL